MNDTFLVSMVDTGYSVADENYHYQRSIVRAKELTKNCSANDYNYCLGMRLNPLGNDNTWIEFRGINRNINTNSSIVTYTLGNKSIKNVYRIKITYNESEYNSPKDVKLIYYTHIYGIIAYELVTGELFELDEQYIE